MTVATLWIVFSVLLVLAAACGAALGVVQARRAGRGWERSADEWGKAAAKWDEAAAQWEETARMWERVAELRRRRGGR